LKNVRIGMGNTNKAQTVSEEDSMEVLGNQCDVNAIAELIKSGRATRIICMVGAGISVSAGIPDFRCDAATCLRNH